MPSYGELLPVNEFRIVELEPTAPYRGPVNATEAMAIMSDEPEAEDYGSAPFRDEIARDLAKEEWPYLFDAESVRQERRVHIARTNEAAAILEPVIRRSDLQPLPGLSARTGNSILIKREDQQPTGAFKLRGAYLRMSQLSDKERQAGVVTASAGNHAQGVALAGRLLGVPVTAVMPETTPEPKRTAVAGYAATIELVGDNYSQAYERAQELAAEGEHEQTLIHPFDDELVTLGQGTIGKEILEQLKAADLAEAEYIFVPVGGGGLAGGIACYVKSVNPLIKVIGVQVRGSEAMAESLKAKKIVSLPKVKTFADGVAVQTPGELTFALAGRYLDGITVVDEDELILAMHDIHAETGVMPEGAGGLSVAGAVKYLAEEGLRDKQVITILSGANIAEERRSYVFERARQLLQKETISAIELPEEPGALEQLCRDVITTHSIHEMHYRKKGSPAHILINCATDGPDDRARLFESLDRFGYFFSDYSDNRTVVEHLRHMIGGISPDSEQEQFFTITFPERPGALAQFLSRIQQHWNISLFSYQNQGGDSAEVAIGFEAETADELEAVFSAAGYEYSRVDDTLVKAFLSH